MRRPLVLLAALVMSLGGLAVAPGPAQAQAAAEPTVTRLPFGHPADVVSAGDRVFISGGRDATQIVVASAAGAITATIDGLEGPTDLQLSTDRRTLYVALPSADKIVAYDTGSLTQSAVHDTAGGTCPSTLAYAGRYLFFGYGCSGESGEIGKIDLARQPAVVTTGLTGQRFGAPRPATALRNSKVLFVGDEGGSPWTGYSYTIGAGGTLTSVGSTSQLGGNLSDAAVDPTGATVYTASGSPYRLQSFSMADPTRTGPSYSIAPYPNAVELTRDGTRIAGGSDAAYDGDVFVFDIDGTSVAAFDLGGRDHLLTRGGLAWAPNGRRLYAISDDGSAYQAPAQLHVLPVPAA
ncbi:beta-propeller fold lactonase family protein [Actinoplanes sp. M2I2]|uniref:beta-propeller fold lactonase family protein n=1 Tax=Actinoplanes sp. M2I2 TaxID=1734444 RepID=UPI00202197A3|nr:beta-propeller fold lactonase family protein [Actinoplanes sp. M2I2]